MALFRRILRTLVYTLLVVLLFAAGTAAVMTVPEKGRDTLASLISDLASTPDRQITVSGIKGIWSGHLGVDRVVIEDADGPWLELHGVEADWSPLALLWGRLEAERVAAERVDFSRLPETPETTVDKGGSSLPVDISIRSLAIPEIRLGEDVTGGQIASVSARGRAVALAQPLTVSTDFTVSRTDETAGELRAAVEFAPDQNKLELDLKASEPSGGILAGILQLPGNPAVDVIVTGSGPLANWRGNATFAIDGALVASATGSHRLTEAGRTIEAKGDGEFARFMPEKLRPMLFGSSGFEIAATLTPSGGLEIRRGALESGAITASATGSYNPAGMTDLALEVEAKGEGLLLPLGTTQSPLDIVLHTLTARAFGEGSEPALDIVASLPRVHAGGARMTDLGITLHSDNFNVAGRSGPVSGSATAAEIAVDNPSLAPLVAGETRAELAGTLSMDALTIAEGSLRSDAVNGGFSGQMSFGDGSVELQLSADVASSALPPQVQSVVGEKVRLSGNLARDAAGTFSADQFALQSDSLAANGSARLSGGNIEAELTGALPDLSRLVPQATGAVSLTANARGALLAPDLDLALTSQRLDLGGRAVDDLELTVSGRADLASPQANVSLKGSFEGQPLQASGMLAGTVANPELRDLSVSLGPNRIAGTLAFDNRLMPVGTLALDLPDLGRLAMLAGQELQGEARGTAKFSREGDEPQLNLTLTAERISRDGIEARTVSVDALVADYLREPRVSGTIGASLPELVAGQPAADMRVTIAGTKAELTGSGTLAMAGEAVSTFTVKHQLTEAGSAIEASGEGAFARFAPEPIRKLLDGRTSFDVAGTVGGGEVKIDRAEFANRAVNASAHGSYNPAGAVDFSLQLASGTAGVPLSFGTDEAPLDLTLGSATLRVQGNAVAPALDIAANFPMVSTGDTRLTDLGISLHSDAFDIAARSGPVTGAATAAALVVDNPALKPLVAGEVRVELAGALSPEALRVTSASLRSDALNGGVSGNISFLDGSINLQLSADVASAALPAQVRTALGERANLSTTITRDSKGDVAADSISLNSEGLTIEGSARLSEGALDARLTGALADISRVSPELSGAASVTASARGSLFSPEVDLALTSDRIGVGDRALDQLNLTASGQVDAANPQGRLSLTASFEGEPLQASAMLASAGTNRQLRDLEVSLGPNKFSGALALDDNFRPTGTLDFDLPELSRLAGLADQQIDGAAKGTLRFSKGRDGPQANLTLNAEAIRRDDIEAQAVSVDALIADFLKAPRLSGTVAATLPDLVPGQPPADIRISFEGPLADTTATGTVAMEGEAVANFSAKHRLTETGSVVEAKGEGAFARFAPEPLDKVLAGETSFDGAVALSGGGPVRIERAEFANPALTASATGTYTPAGPLDLDLQIGAGMADVPLSFGTDDAPLDMTVGAASIRLTGDPVAAALDVTASLKSVATNTVRLTDLGITLHSDRFDLRSRAGPVSGAVTAAELKLENQTLAPLVAGKVLAEIQGALSADALTVEKGILRSDAIDGNFHGTVSLRTGSVTLDLNADVLSSALPPAARPVLAEKVTLSTSLVRDQEGNVSANALALQSGDLTGQGIIRVGAGNIDAEIAGSLADVSPLADKAAGSIAFTASAKGAFSAPDVALKVTCDRMTVADRAIENLELNASGKADLANLQASVSLKGRVGGQPLDGKAVLSTAGGVRAVRDLALTLGPNRVSGSLTLREDFVPEGSIAFDLPEVGPLAALALQKVEGSAKGKATLTREGGKAQARIALNSDAISREDFSANSVSLDALIADYLSSPGISGKVRAGEIRSGTTIVRDLEVDLSREGGWTRFDGGLKVNDIPVRAAGRAKVEDGTTTVDFTSAEATVRGVRTALARPATVRVENGQAALDKLSLALDGGTATVSGTAGSSLALDVALSKLPASLADAFAPGLDAAGTISGTVRISGTAGAPNVRYDIDWSGAQTAQTRATGVGALSLRSEGTFENNRLSFDATVDAGSGIRLRSSGTVGTAGVPQLNINIEGSVPFSVLAARLAEQGLSLTGTADADITITGGAAAPVVGGSVKTSGARIVHVDSGVAVEDIAAEIALGGGRATISRLTGKLAAGGTISGSGSIGLADGFSADITLKLSDARYTDGEVVTTTISGDLTLDGPLAASPQLGGTVNLGRTVIQVPERLPGSLAALNVKHRNAPADVIAQDRALRPRTPATGTGGGGLTLDLTVNAPQQIFVQGRGLDAELGGSLKLIGSLSSPQATGEFTLRRGRLTLLGRRLVFTRGTLDFAGSLVPNLDLAAESRASDATATVLVTGPANDPQFTFTSTPALPQDEVLARLIFGRAMSNLSPLQIAQLADAAAQLAGAGGSTSLLNSLRDTLGVDDLDVRTTEEGGTAVSIGKHLNERTYITIESGDRAGSGRAAIDLDVGRGVKLRGEARTDGEAKGGIFYEKEY